MVILNPMQVTIVNAAPRASGGASRAMSAENIGESATTAMPQIRRKAISTVEESLPRPPLEWRIAPQLFAHLHYIRPFSMKSFRIRCCHVLWALTILVSLWFYGKHGRESYNFYGDALGYYMYLPATFIYDNHKSIEKLPSDRGIRPFIHAYAAQIGNGQRTPKGYVLNQYTYGIALMEAPFFLAAHAWEQARGGLANGFTDTYRNAIKLSTLFYAGLGLWITYRVLRRRVSPEAASITTALLLLGTNLFWFVLHQQGMAHVPLFFLFALLMLLTIKVYESRRWPYFAALGLCAGLITVIRPVDGLCVLIPLLYHSGRPFWLTKLQFIRDHWPAILLAGCCFILPLIPQLLYWKWLTGYTIYDSYGTDQGFDFLHPAVLKGLLGASNGWLSYTPLMIVSIAGLALVRRMGAFAIAVPLFLVLYVWGVYSWYLPNYPNGLGSRPMVDVYPLLGLPLAAAIQWILERGRRTQVLAAIVVLGLAAVNIGFARQQARGVIWSEDSKHAYNIRMLFGGDPAYKDLVLWDLGIPQPDMKGWGLLEKACAGAIDSAGRAHDVTDSAGHVVYRMASGEEYARLAVELPLARMGGEKARWLRPSGRFRVYEEEHNIYQNALLVLQLRRGDSVIAWHGVRINNKVGLLEHPSIGGAAGLMRFRHGLSGRISYVVPVPEGARDEDMLRLDVWNIGKRPLDISELCLDAFE